MTTHLHLPVHAITGVRLVCRKCGASVSIPLGAVNAPAKCFNCHTPLPGPEIVRNVAAGLKWLQDAATDNNVTFDAALEGELETHLHP